MVRLATAITDIIKVNKEFKYVESNVTNKLNVSW